MDKLKTIIITGANSGLGFETAKKIAENKDYHIVLACRNLQKAELAKQDLIKETENQNIECLKLDTSSLKSVEEFVVEFQKSNDSLYGLINNAGISGMHQGKSVDNVEIVMATNYLGHWYLTNLLLEKYDIKKIFNVTSDMHNPPQGLKWRDVKDIFNSDNSDRTAYPYSKLGNIYFTNELQDRLIKENKDTLVNSFNPGMMQTNFAGGPMPKSRILFVKTMMPDRCGDLDKSSTALASLMLDDSLTTKAKYFDRSVNYKDSSPLSYNINNQKELWDYTDNFIKEWKKK